MDRKLEKYYRIGLHKAYFDEGLNITNYFKYLIAFFGIASGDAASTLLIAGGYAIFCYFFGMWLFKSGAREAFVEVGNVHNAFMKEVRKKLK